MSPRIDLLSQIFSYFAFSSSCRELGGAATGPIAYCKDTLFAAIRSPKGEHEVAVITLKENQTTDEDVDDAPTTSGTDPAARVRLGAETRHIAAATHRSAVLVACADGTVHLVSVSGSIKASESLDSSRSILASATRARDGALVLLSSLPKAPGSVRIDVFAVQEASPGNDRIVRLLSGPVVAPDGAGSPVAVAVSSDEAHVLWSSGAFQSVAVPASHASAQHADVPVVFARAFTGFVPAGCSPVGAPAESRKRGRTEPGNAVGKVLAATSAGHVVVFGRAKGDSAEVRDCGRPRAAPLPALTLRSDNLAEMFSEFESRHSANGFFLWVGCLERGVAPCLQLGKDGDAAVVLFDTKHACVHAVVKMPDVQAACSGIWVLVSLRAFVSLLWPPVCMSAVHVICPHVCGSSFARAFVPSRQEIATEQPPQVEEFERGAVVLAVGAERSVQTVTLALGAPSLARALALRRDGVDCQRVIFGREGGGRLAAGVVAAPVAVKAVVKDVEVGEGDLAGDEGDVAPLAECPLNLQVRCPG